MGSSTCNLWFNCTEFSGVTRTRAVDAVLRDSPKFCGLGEFRSNQPLLTGIALSCLLHAPHHHDELTEIKSIVAVFVEARE
jgi:hypothetical protein